MMGWRVGYIAYPDFDGEDTIGQELIKMQDTICICGYTFMDAISLEKERSALPPAHPFPPPQCLPGHVTCCFY